MEDLRKQSRYRVNQLFGQDAFYESLTDVVAAYRKLPAETGHRAGEDSSDVAG